MTNLNRLRLELLATVLTPKGEGPVDVALSLNDPNRLAEADARAGNLLANTLLSVRNSPEWKEKTDEEIATAILNQVHARRQKLRDERIRDQQATTEAQSLPPQGPT
jgi:hypothetical protein